MGDSMSVAEQARHALYTLDELKVLFTHENQETLATRRSVYVMEKREG